MSNKSKTKKQTISVRKVYVRKLNILVVRSKMVSPKKRLKMRIKRGREGKGGEGRGRVWWFGGKFVTLRCLWDGVVPGTVFVDKFGCLQPHEKMLKPLGDDAKPLGDIFKPLGVFSDRFLLEFCL